MLALEHDRRRDRPRRAPDPHRSGGAMTDLLRARWQSPPWFVVLLIALLLEMLLAPMMPTTASGLRTARIVTVIVLGAILPAVGISRVSVLVIAPALYLAVMISRLVGLQISQRV
jgi:hypothetical protein